MRTFQLIALALSLFGGATSAAPPAHPIVHPTSAELIRAARTAPMSAFSAGGATCGASCTADQWLTRLTRGAPVRWSTGRCLLRDEDNAPEGRGRVCVQAVILMRGEGPPPMVEIDLEGSRGGRPGLAYALRGVVAEQGGDDYALTPEDFESGWVARYQR